MPDIDKILEAVERCEDPDKLRSWIRNAKAQGQAQLEETAFRRLVSILPAADPGTVEYDFWQTIHAFEQVLAEERGKTTRLQRTRQKVARVGEIKTLEDWALGDKDTDGFEMLIARGMPEYTGEAIVIRHAAQFSAEVVAAATARLAAAGVHYVPPAAEA